MPDDLGGIAVSPDGRWAIVTLRPADVTLTLWLHDLTRHMKSRLSPPTGASGPAAIWAPDGKRIVFAGIRPGSPVRDLYWKDVGGSDEHLLLKNEQMKSPSDWSSDDQYLVYTQESPKTGADIWVLPSPAAPSGTNPKPFPFANTQFLESQGQPSSGRSLDGVRFRRIRAARSLCLAIPDRPRQVACVGCGRHGATLECRREGALLPGGHIGQVPPAIGSRSHAARAPPRRCRSGRPSYSSKIEP
jgi:WD40 repeat protein